MRSLTQKLTHASRFTLSESRKCNGGQRIRTSMRLRAPHFEGDSRPDAASRYLPVSARFLSVEHRTNRPYRTPADATTRYVANPFANPRFGVGA